MLFLKKLHDFRFCITLYFLGLMLSFSTAMPDDGVILLFPGNCHYL